MLTVGFATMAVMITGGIVATVSIAGDPPADTASAWVDPATRQEAADRADRSGRTADAPATEAPANTAAPNSAAPNSPAPNRAAPKEGKAPSTRNPVAPKQAPMAKAEPKPAWVNPMPGAPLSSCFGSRWGTQHQGIDFAGDSGTKILAAGAGTVVTTGWNYTGYGISVVVDHRDGYLTHYAHAQRVLVRPGQAVGPGQAIAIEGNTGDSLGPHLHFEVHRSMWNQVDPASWLRKRGVVIGC
jgi:murein DD-endopeptidase MepM/ murein hydrolase activator NlpD